MIGKMELELSSKNMTIAYLAQEVTKMMGGWRPTQTQTPTPTPTPTPTANDMLMF
jgi:hypothetical protein